MTLKVAGTLIGSVPVGLLDVHLEYLMTCIPFPSYKVDLAAVSVFVVLTRTSFCIPLCVGTSSYIKSLDTEVWTHCYQLHASDPEALYPAEFKMAADAILARDFRIEEGDITVDNVQMLYLHLINEISA